MGVAVVDGPIRRGEPFEMAESIIAVAEDGPVWFCVGFDLPCLGVGRVRCA